MYSTHCWSQSLKIIPTIIANQSLTQVSCIVTLASSQASKLKECISYHEFDKYVTRRDMSNPLYFENKSH